MSSMIMVRSILRSRKRRHYLQPFFKYDLGKIYAIAWDGEENGGLDRDRTTR